ncbi:hypothetical protein [Virgibacillus sp. CBA3643]|uniref:hypothetical protein n=1 Tax=Virgibacillus sp. CBA3643 TaxID=2942278 RepID=UPI0035A32815
MPCSDYKGAGYYQNMYFQLCAYFEGINVEVSIEPTEYIGLGAELTYWTMYLQRRNDSIYETIATREGYVSPSSPSYRTFTNIRNTPNMRVFVDYYNIGVTNRVFL